MSVSVSESFYIQSSETLCGKIVKIESIITGLEDLAGANVSNDDEATLEATTWTKLGIYCDGSTVTFFKDGVALATTTTTATADFPDGEEMAFYLQNMCGAAGTVGTVTLDWLRIAQEY